jgi:hypothetical protein
MSKLMSALVNMLLLAALFAGYVLVEYVAYLGFLHAPAGVDPLLAGFAVQALVALVQALLLRQMLPSRYREPRFWTLLLLWVLCTFVPLGAGFVLLASCLWAAWFPGTRDSDQMADVPRPEFVTYLVSRVSHQHAGVVHRPAHRARRNPEHAHPHHRHPVARTAGRSN